MIKTDTILVSVDFTHGGENDVMLVGRKSPGETVKIINSFQGQKARNLYNQIIEKGGK